MTSAHLTPLQVIKLLSFNDTRMNLQGLLGQDRNRDKSKSKKATVWGRGHKKASAESA